MEEILEVSNLAGLFQCIVKDCKVIDYLMMITLMSNASSQLTPLAINADTYHQYYLLPRLETLDI